MARARLTSCTFPKEILKVLTDFHGNRRNAKHIYSLLFSYTSGAGFPPSLTFPWKRLPFKAEVVAFRMISRNRWKRVARTLKIHCIFKVKTEPESGDSHPPPYTFLGGGTLPPLETTAVPPVVFQVQVQVEVQGRTVRPEFVFMNDPFAKKCPPPGP